MNRRQKIIVSITGIFLVLLILVGLTYAYFLTRIKGNENEKSISVTTANLELTYGDGTNKILTTTDPIIPSNDPIGTKDFTVTNNGNATVNNYAVYLEDIENKLTRTSDLVYTLTCTSSVRNKTCNGKSETVYPNKNGILVTNSIDKDEVQTYVLTLTYKEMNEDQSEDMNKTINGKIQIYNLKDIVDIEGTVTNALATDYVQINSVEKKSQIINGEYKLPAVEPGVHTIRVFDKDGAEKSSRQITIKKGKTTSVSGNTITVTPNSQVITMNLDRGSTSSDNVSTDINDYNPYSSGTLPYTIYKSAVLAKETNDNTRTNIGNYFETINGDSDYRIEKITDQQIGNWKGGCWFIDGDYQTGTQAKNLKCKDLINKDITDMCGSAPKIVKCDGETPMAKQLGYVKDLNSVADDYGTSYYFRGNVVDNYVSFANQTWRIIRINGDGSVRLILNSSIGTSKFNEQESVYKDNAGVGYMYGTPGSTTYEATHENKNDSTVKTVVDSWYETNIENTTKHYGKYLSDTLFCGDKTPSTGTGIGTTKTVYLNPYSFLPPSATSSYNIIMTCANSSKVNYSRYTVNKSTLKTGIETNGNLKYPIGLISAHEALAAGAYQASQKNLNYLSSISTHTMTPAYYNSSGLMNGSRYSSVYVLGSTGIYDPPQDPSPGSISPVINLKSDLKVSSGDGTETSPYTLILN